jgi:signal transduction histidine kinase
MNKTVTDFTNFFKPDKKMQSVLLEDSIKECYGLICEIFTQSEILVNIYAKDEISIKIYEGEFKQVILNILNNAKDALIENTIENKKIDIKIFKENNNAVITIEDNAKGIPKKIIKNIFEPYFSTKESNGTGLGLYMSKTIIEKHLKGEIFVQNSNIGAIFTIKIPL